MNTDHPALRHPVGHFVVFTVGSALWIALLGVGAAVILIATGEVIDTAFELGPRALGLLTLLQNFGMTGLAIGLARLLPGASFPVGRPGVWWAAGFLAGAFVWTLPSWMAEVASTQIQSGALNMVTNGLTSDDVAGRAILSVAVAFGAPLFEELVFRGYLWRAFEARWGPQVAFGVTTVAFCAWHLDPVQSVCLLPTAACIGWLRLRSGSLVPAIACHFVNNALGVALAGWDQPLGPIVAFGGALVTVVVLGAAEALSRRSTP